MALIIVAENISNLAEVSDYRVRVFVNDHQIAEGNVTGHHRKDGWKALAELIGTHLENEKNEAALYREMVLNALKD